MAAKPNEPATNAMADSKVSRSSSKLAAAEGDPAANAFLQWFVNEQVEEEASADAVVQKLKLLGDSPGPLLMLDHELGRREAGEG